MNNMNLNGAQSAQTNQALAGQAERCVSRNYPLDILNVGEDDYIVMSKGHHDPHEFMQAVRNEGYEWPLGFPEHKWMRAVPAPKNSGFIFFYVEAVQGSKGAFPATYAYEAYGDERYEALPANDGNKRHEPQRGEGRA